MLRGTFIGCWKKGKVSVSHQSSYLRKLGKGQNQLNSAVRRKQSQEQKSMKQKTGKQWKESVKTNKQKQQFFEESVKLQDGQK